MIMQKIFIFGFLSMAFAIIACKQQPSQQDDSAATARKKASTERIRAMQVTGPLRIQNETLQLIWPAYEQLRDALVVMDVMKARDAAWLIAEGTRGQRGFETIFQSAMQTVKTPDASKQRIHFSPLSNTMIEMLRNTGIKEGKLFVAYCPMAFDYEGGYWLTAQRKVINPYFGDEMLTCGSIKETIQQESSPQ
jgi:hypothetical protein